MNNNVLVSIITVTYNAQKYLEDTIKSVLNQTYPNIEYIIIDGGSTDNTLNVIKKYEDEISYWISESDNGIYDAMNKGIKQAKGEIVGILNADDFYKSFAIEEIVQAYSMHDADIYYSDMNLIDKDTKYILQTRIADDQKLYFGMTLNHPVTFIKKTIYDKLLFDTDYKIASDYDLLLKCKLNHKSFYHIQKVLGSMRDGGISTANKIASTEETLIRKTLLSYHLFLLTTTVKFIKIFYNKVFA